MACHAHNQERVAGRIRDVLKSGLDVAYVTDSGTPGVSDPGSVLVKQIIRSQIPVKPVPGPSAVTAALSISGMAAGSWFFQGFLPRKKGQRNTRLCNLKDMKVPVVIFESPRRLERLLDEMTQIMPQRPLCVCRELTKTHEEIARGMASEVKEQLARRMLGEITIVMAGRDE